MARRKTDTDTDDTEQTVTLYVPASVHLLGVGDIVAGQAITVPASLAGRATDPAYTDAALRRNAAIAANDIDAERAITAELDELGAAGAAGYGLLAAGYTTTPPTTTTTIAANEGVDP